MERCSLCAIGFRFRHIPLLLRWSCPIGKINMLDSTLNLMKSHNAKSVADNCLFKEKAFTLGADGKPKGKCMMGDNADCDKCGCVVPFYMATLNSPKLIAKEALKKAVGRN